MSGACNADMLWVMPPASAPPEQRRESVRGPSTCGPAKSSLVTAERGVSLSSTIVPRTPAMRRSAGSATSWPRKSWWSRPPASASMPWSAPRASEPGGNLLVGDDLRVGVTRPGQRHDEDPGAQQLTGTQVEDLGTLAEVDLRRLAGVELQYGGDLWVSGLDACEEAAHRGVRAGEAVAAYQGAVDGGALDSLTPPVGTVFANGRD